MRVLISWLIFRRDISTTDHRRKNHDERGIVMIKENDNVEIVVDKYINFSKTNMKGYRAIVVKNVENQVYKVMIPFSDCDIYLFVTRNEIIPVDMTEETKQ
jgi:hypothetical protein